jgi:hypothetical protein
MREHLSDNSVPGQPGLVARPVSVVLQPTWQRITLLIVLFYEGLGALLGGVLLIAEPDGRLMDMPVEIMHGFFRDFSVPGVILTGLGILNSAAFIAVLNRARIDWLLSGFGMGGLAIWFIIEIIILKDLHWLHAMWGIPVLAGCLVTLPLVSSRWSACHHSQDG